MKIIYGTKDSHYSMGIQVTSQVDEDITPLITELTEKGFVYEKSRIPLSFPNKANTTTLHFYRSGSRPFGLKTLDEVNAFVDDSHVILKRYDKTFKKTRLFPYDND